MLDSSLPSVASFGIAAVPVFSSPLPEPPFSPISPSFFRTVTADINIEMFLCVCLYILQVNKKFCELEGGNIGIVEKAQETRFGMSPKYSRELHWDSILESCFVSYVIVKSPSKPYMVVHSHTALLHE